MISNGSTSLAKSASDRVSRWTFVDDDHVDLSRASASTAASPSSQPNEASPAHDFADRPMRIMIGSTAYRFKHALSSSAPPTPILSIAAAAARVSGSRPAIIERSSPQSSVSRSRREAALAAPSESRFTREQIRQCDRLDLTFVGIGAGVIEGISQNYSRMVGRGRRAGI